MDRISVFCFGLPILRLLVEDWRGLTRFSSHHLHVKFRLSLAILWSLHRNFVPSLAVNFVRFRIVTSLIDLGKNCERRSTQHRSIIGRFLRATHETPRRFCTICDGICHVELL